MAALGAALSGLIVLNNFRSSEEGSADADVASRPSSGAIRQDERRAAGPPAQDDRVSPSSSQGSDATVAAGGDAPATPQSVPVLLPNQVPATPMSQALEDLQIPPIPELLETEREFAAQSTDPSWSTATEARILDQIAGIAGLALASLNVECRTTLCRVQFVQPGTVPGLPNGSAVFPSLDRAPAVGAPGMVKIVGSTGLKSRWVIAVRDRNGTPVSLAYLERGSDQ
jgi:hypothetical protein